MNSGHFVIVGRHRKMAFRHRVDDEIYDEGLLCTQLSSNVISTVEEHVDGRGDEHGKLVVNMGTLRTSVMIKRQVRSMSPNLFQIT